MNGIADFGFHCHRCGLCCRTGHGRVWIEAEAVPELAAACGESAQSFTAQRVLEVDGRLSLRERADGCCSLLEDGNRCRAYEARPAQCRSFPFWPEILAGGAALEAAAGMCPGIQRVPERELAERVLPLAAELIRAAAPASGASSTPGERWLNALEADLELAGWLPGSGAHGRLDARARFALEELAERSDYPWSVGQAARILAERAEAWDSLRGGPPRWTGGAE